MRFKPRHLDNESGMTLVIVIVLAAAALMIMSALIYMATSGTEVSGMGARYTNAFEAAVGGTDAVRGLIGVGSAPAFAATWTSGAPTFSNAICTDEKLNYSTSDWTLSGKCLANSNSWIISSTSYDMKLNLGGNYTVYAKIVDTIRGNTQRSTGLVKTGVVGSSAGTVPVPAIPYIYTFEALANATTPERSRVSGVYEY